MSSKFRLQLLAVVAAPVLVAACKDSGGSEPPPPEPVPAAVSLNQTSLSFDAVGAVDTITATVTDDEGGVISNADVTWTSDDVDVATVADGVVTSTGNGTAAITASSGTVQEQVTVTVDQVPVALAVAAGDSQAAPPNEPLVNPVVAEVQDRLGAGVPDVEVTFAVTSGGGSVDPATDTTDAAGQAQTTWTMGPTEGDATLDATATGIAGGQVTFAARAADISLTAISPDTLVEGQSATLTGTGFDPTPTQNTVTVDGVAATITGGTTTTLTITVPSGTCQPARAVGVRVIVSDFPTNTLTHPLQPASFDSDLAVGEQRIVMNPADFCLQFRESSTAEEFLIGVGSSSEASSSTMSFTMTTVTDTSTVSPAPAFVAASDRSVASGGGMQLDDPELWQARLEHYRAERNLRDYEQRFLNPARNPGMQPAFDLTFNSTAAQVVPSVGDTIDFRIPNADGDPCDFIAVSGEVRVIGAAGIWVTDLDNPTDDSLTLAELQAASDTFDQHIFAEDTLYFGSPSDLDENQRIFILFSVEVNKLVGGQVAGFVFSGDLLSRDQCASSDFGEVFYSHVPDPDNEAGTRSRTKAIVLRQMPSLVAHEFTHLIQISKRVFAGPSPTFMTSWEMEGQAVFAEEVVGHSILGNQPGQDLGATDAFQGQAGDWYDFIFVRLAWYYGWRGGGTTVQNPGAPELCTLFGNLSDLFDSTPCEPFYFYGASWSFQRYLADRIGPGFVGTDSTGEVGLHRDWIAANTDLSGVANVEALTGLEFDSLFAQWAAMHYVDGRLGGADPNLLMSSWDLFDVFEGTQDPSVTRLVPKVRNFTDFSEQQSVRGGSVFFVRLNASGAHPAAAFRIRDPSDAVLSGTMSPQIWVVRTQ